MPQDQIGMFVEKPVRRPKLLPVSGEKLRKIFQLKLLHPRRRGDGRKTIRRNSVAQLPEFAGQLFGNALFFLQFGDLPDIARNPHPFERLDLGSEPDSGIAVE